jgi:hypothetical protein
MGNKPIKMVISKSYSPWFTHMAGEWLLDHGADPSKVKLKGTRYDRNGRASVDLDRWDPLLVECVKVLGDRAGNVYVSEATGPFIIDLVQDSEIIVHRDACGWIDLWTETKTEVAAPITTTPALVSPIVTPPVEEPEEDFVDQVGRAFWGGSVRDEDAFTAAKGRTITGVTGLEKGSSLLTISTDKGDLTLRHYRDCCESVSIEDFEGDESDLIGGIIVEAEETTNHPSAEGSTEDVWAESHTWTFYKFRTTKGDLWVRWLGMSNGYYSESVTVEFFGR